MAQNSIEICWAMANSSIVLAWSAGGEIHLASYAHSLKTLIITWACDWGGDGFVIDVNWGLTQQKLPSTIRLHSRCFTQFHCPHQRILMNLNASTRDRTSTPFPSRDKFLIIDFSSLLSLSASSKSFSLQFNFRIYIRQPSTRNSFRLCADIFSLFIKVLLAGLSWPESRFRSHSSHVSMRKSALCRVRYAHGTLVPLCMTMQNFLLASFSRR